MDVSHASVNVLLSAYARTFSFCCWWEPFRVDIRSVNTEQCNTGRTVCRQSKTDDVEPRTASLSLEKTSPTAHFVYLLGCAVFCVIRATPSLRRVRWRQLRVVSQARPPGAFGVSVLVALPLRCPKRGADV